METTPGAVIVSRWRLLITIFSLQGPAMTSISCGPTKFKESIAACRLLKAPAVAPVQSTVRMLAYAGIEENTSSHANTKENNGALLCTTQFRSMRIFLSTHTLVKCLETAGRR